jgi:hypothetical protein
MSFKELAEDLHKLNAEFEKRDKIEELVNIAEVIKPEELGLIIFGIIAGGAVNDDS